MTITENKISVLFEESDRFFFHIKSKTCKHFFFKSLFFTDNLTPINPVRLCQKNKLFSILYIYF